MIAPYTAEQNGNVERKNRTLKNIFRVLEKNIRFNIFESGGVFGESWIPSFKRDRIVLRTVD